MHFRYLTSVKKYDKIWKQNNLVIQGILLPEWSHPLERYNNIASLIIGDTDYDLKRIRSAKNINIEDYSMGSKGKVFNIAENTGILKNYLWQRDIEYNTIPPTVVKKFATGKGNSPKEVVYEYWLKETSIDLMDLMDCKSEKVPSPINDICDAYFLAKLDKWTK